MTSFVAGATGATGRLLVRELLQRKECVRVVVRSVERLPRELSGHDGLEATEASLLDLSDGELAEQLRGCRAVASCLGHNMTFRGMYGAPRRLVTEATRRLCDAVDPGGPSPTRFVLMNTSGNRNRDLDEPISLAQRSVLALLRLLVPPHADNEQAADYLRLVVGQRHPRVEWAAVRPDTLIDLEAVTPYDIHPSPTRSAIFDAGQTSRINVAHFMAELMTDDSTWSQWKGQMPVIYNADG